MPQSGLLRHRNQATATANLADFPFGPRCQTSRSASPTLSTMAHADSDDSNRGGSQPTEDAVANNTSEGEEEEEFFDARLTPEEEGVRNIFSLSAVSHNR